MNVSAVILSDAVNAMKRKGLHTKHIAIAAMLSALCCVILSLGVVFESLDLTFATVSAIIIWIALLEFGYKLAWGIFFPTAFIAVLFLPSKFPALFFTFVTGWYPMFKLSIGKRIKKKSLLWTIKLICFNIVSLALIFGIELFGKAFGITFDEEMTKAWLIAMLVLCNIAFLVTDILMDRLVVVYIYKVRDKLVRLKIVDKKH